MENVISIEQDQGRAQAAAEFARDTAMQSVRLAASKVDAGGSAFHRSPLGSLSTALEFSTGEVIRSESLICLVVNCKYAIRRIDDSEGDPNTVEIACSFEAQYSVRPNYIPNEAQIAAFHHGSATMHIWPYFREYVQNTVVRTGLPAPPVPMLCLVPASEPKIEAPAEAQQAPKRLQRVRPQRKRVKAEKA